MTDTQTRPIVLDLQGAGVQHGWRYRVAGFELWCDVELPAMTGERGARPESELTAPLGGCDVLVYDGEGLVGGRVQRIRSLLGEGGRCVEYEDGESFRIDATGSRIWRLAANASAEVAAPTLERALGAPLVLALAMRGVYVLHASALRGARGVVALTAESGGGKSTLAASAETFPELGLERVADDQLAVRLGDASVVLPGFPQLKLESAEARSIVAGTELPLTMLVELVRDDPTSDDRLELTALARPAAGAALARATVAARLFDDRLLGKHFADCAVAAGSLTVLRLRFPSGHRRLREVLALLSERLSCSGGA